MFRLQVNGDTVVGEGILLERAPVRVEEHSRLNLALDTAKVVMAT